MINAQKSIVDNYAIGKDGYAGTKPEGTISFIDNNGKSSSSLSSSCSTSSSYSSSSSSSTSSASASNNELLSNEEVAIYEATQASAEIDVSKIVFNDYVNAAGQERTAMNDLKTRNISMSQNQISNDSSEVKISKTVLQNWED